MQLLGKTGEICRIVNPLDDEIPEDVYIIAEDPAPFDPEDEIYVVNLRDLQRHIKNPSAAPRLQIAKAELSVIAGSLNDYIAGWNN